MRRDWTNVSTCASSTLDIYDAPSQEGTDTLLLYHALSIGNHAEIAIASPYTYVFLLMDQMYPSVPCYICFHTGNRNLKRNISVQPMYNTVGHRRASAILCFHAQTGSDMSGQFAGRTSEWCLKVFKAYGDDILNALESVGH